MTPNSVFARSRPLLSSWNEATSRTAAVRAFLVDRLEVAVGAKADIVRRAAGGHLGVGVVGVQVRDQQGVELVNRQPVAHSGRGRVNQDAHVLAAHDVEADWPSHWIVQVALLRERGRDILAGCTGRGRRGVHRPPA